MLLIRLGLRCLTAVGGIVAHAFRWPKVKYRRILVLTDDALKGLQSFKESFIEILMVVKVCLTSFWFWLPVLYCVYFYFQILLIFWVHPLTILILPLILSVYLILLQEKRVKAFYEINKVRYISASEPFGEGPKVKPFKWKVEESVREYEKLLKEKQKEQKD